MSACFDLLEFLIALKTTIQKTHAYIINPLSVTMKKFIDLKIKQRIVFKNV